MRIRFKAEKGKRVKSQRVVALVCCFTLFSSAFVGCGYEETSVATKEEFLSMNPSPVIDYVSMENVPSILVDRSGYNCEDEKKVLFLAKEMPSAFTVSNQETGEIVYTGEVTQKEKASVGVGDFSEVITPGIYRVLANKLGESYDFVIEEDVNRPLMQKQMETLGKTRDKKINASYLNASGEVGTRILQGGWLMDESGKQDVGVACEMMMTLLTSYELFPDPFDEEITEDMPTLLSILYHESVWLLLMQDEVTGGIYGCVENKAEKEDSDDYWLSDLDKKTSLMFAAAMAKFSYVFKDIDQNYASLCLKAADLAFKYVEPTKEELEDEEFTGMLGAASVELYRASGLLNYYNFANTYLTASMDISANCWNFFGVITYLITRKTVDGTRCAALIKSLLKCGENISNASRTDSYLVSVENKKESEGELLWNAVILSTANYILTSNEYQLVIEDHRHFLLGRNPISKDYVSGKEYPDRFTAEEVFMEAQILEQDYFVAPSDNDYN